MDLIAKAVTLKSIKLFDPTAQSVVFSAKHAILYAFTDSNEWKKTSFEGSLAIYTHANHSHHLTILNRLQPRSFTFPLSGGNVVAVELQGNLLMLKLKSGIRGLEDEVGSVVGIWFFEDEERQLASTLIAQLKDDVLGDVNTKASVTNTGTKHISIMDLLSKAAVKSTPLTSLDDILFAEFKDSWDKDADVNCNQLANIVSNYIKKHPECVKGLLDRLQQHQ